MLRVAFWHEKTYDWVPCYTLMLNLHSSHFYPATFLYRRNGIFCKNRWQLAVLLLLPALVVGCGGGGANSGQTTAQQQTDQLKKVEPEVEIEPHPGPESQPGGGGGANSGQTSLKVNEGDLNREDNLRGSLYGFDYWLTAGEDNNLPSIFNSNNLINPTGRTDFQFPVADSEVEVTAIYKGEDSFIGSYNYKGKREIFKSDVIIRVEIKNDIVNIKGQLGDIDNSLRMGEDDFWGLAFGHHVDERSGSFTENNMLFGLWPKLVNKDKIGGVSPNRGINSGTGTIKGAFSSDYQTEPATLPGFVAGEVRVIGFHKIGESGTNNSLSAVFVAERQHVYRKEKE